jgi:hypothetical protein
MNQLSLSDDLKAVSGGRELRGKEEKYESAQRLRIS